GGGQANLYEAVGNHPTGALDPGGLSEDENGSFAAEGIFALRPKPQSVQGDAIAQINNMPLNQTLYAGSAPVYGNGNQNAAQAMASAGPQIMGVSAIAAAGTVAAPFVAAGVVNSPMAVVTGYYAVGGVIQPLIEGHPYEAIGNLLFSGIPFGGM